MHKFKTLNLRMSKELWVFLKRKSINEERSMTEIIISLIEKLRRKNGINKEEKVERIEKID